MAFDLVGKAVKNLRLPTVDYNSPIKIIPAQEGDINSRFFSITLFDDRGDIPLSIYTSACLNATLPDGEVQMATGEVDQEKNVVICKISGSMLTQLGKVACDVLLTGQDRYGDSTSLTSQTFYVFVAKSQASDDSIEGSDDYTLLVQLLNEVSELENHIEAAEKARVASEQARITAEATRNSNESTRTSEYERLTDELTSAILTANDTVVMINAAKQTADELCSELQYCHDAETGRQEAENARTISEAERHLNEELRVDAEQARTDAEQARTDAENERITNEENRIVAETKRAEECDVLLEKLNLSLKNINSAAENAATAEETFAEIQKYYSAPFTWKMLKLGVSSTS